MIPIVTSLSGVDNVAPFAKVLWCGLSFTEHSADNTEAQLVHFLDHNFARTCCGELLLDTIKACEPSAILASIGPVGYEVVQEDIASWKDIGLLHG